MKNLISEIVFFLKIGFFNICLFIGISLIFDCQMLILLRLAVAGFILAVPVGSALKIFIKAKGIEWK